jgi:CRP/FNR family transcriptional regulator, nitrogen oxide reductase regulator
MTASAVAPITGLRSPLLEGLPPRDIDSVLGAATQRRLLNDSVVINQGDPANNLFLLTRGRARYFFTTPEGRRILLRWLVPGDVFGGMAILSRPSAYLVSTELLKDSHAFVWDRATIRGLAARYPKLMDNALSIAADYVAWDLDLHVNLNRGSARERLAAVLLNLAQGIGQKMSGGLEVEVTNEDLAAASNLTLFTVSRLLSEWHRGGAIVKSRGKVLLRYSQDSCLPKSSGLLPRSARLPG